MINCNKYLTSVIKIYFFKIFLLNISCETFLGKRPHLSSGSTCPPTLNSLSTLIVLAGGVRYFLAIDDRILSYLSVDLLSFESQMTNRQFQWDIGNGN